jgi:hypothetical protein
METCILAGRDKWKPVYLQAEINGNLYSCRQRERESLKAKSKEGYGREAKQDSATFTSCE